MPLLPPEVANECAGSRNGKYAQTCEYGKCIMFIGTYLQASAI